MVGGEKMEAILAVIDFKKNIFAIRDALVGVFGRSHLLTELSMLVSSNTPRPVLLLLQSLCISYRDILDPHSIYIHAPIHELCEEKYRATLMWMYAHEIAAVQHEGALRFECWDDQDPVIDVFIKSILRDLKQQLIDAIADIATPERLPQAHNDLTRLIASFLFD